MIIDRFINLPIKLVSQKDVDMGIDNDGKDAQAWIASMEIEEFYETTDNEIPCIHLYLRSSRSFLVYCTMKEFIEKLSRV